MKLVIIDPPFILEVMAGKDSFDYGESRSSDEKG